MMKMTQQKSTRYITYIYKNLFIYTWYICRSTQRSAYNNIKLWKQTGAREKWKMKNKKCKGKLCGHAHTTTHLPISDEKPSGWRLQLLKFVVCCGSVVCMSFSSRIIWQTTYNYYSLITYAIRVEIFRWKSLKIRCFLCFFRLSSPKSISISYAKCQIRSRVPH